MLKCAQPVITKTVAIEKKILKKASHWTITSNDDILKIILPAYNST